MHYLILHWNDESLKWDIVYYCHKFDLYWRVREKYPEPEYVHLVDIKSIEAFQFCKMVESKK